jgi:hypothetical protein
MHAPERRLNPWTALCALSLALAPLAGCSDDGGGGSADEADTGAVDGGMTADGSTEDGSGGDKYDIPDNADCDPLVPGYCSMPWPSAKFLVEDSGTKTGYALRFGETTLPANTSGVHIDARQFDHLDGFTPGSPFLTYFENLDDANIPGELDIAKTLDDDSPVLLYRVIEGETDTVERVPCWAELDGNEPDAKRRVLFIRPAVHPAEDTRYIVALRFLKDREGNDIPRSDAFEALAAGEAAGTPVADRQARFDEIFALLQADGINKDDLVLAWDFHMASTDTLHGRLLQMVNSMYDGYGEDGGPTFHFYAADAVPGDAPTAPKDGYRIRAKQKDDPAAPEYDEHIAYDIIGTFETPHWMEPAKVGKDKDIDAWRFARDESGAIKQVGTRFSEVRVLIPWSALDGTPHGVLIHGHGQNGTHNQISGGFYKKLANTEDLLIVGVNMLGMSSEDVPGIVGMLFELSDFHTMADRLHQGVLDHASVMRGFKNTFDGHAEIAKLGVKIDKDALYYSGISQGGIYGGTFMATSKDMLRGHLGVPGNNYSTLLHRSKNFGEFFAIIKLNYNDTGDQAILLSTIQLLWDSCDPNTHYVHIKKNPHPGFPEHDVLLVSATGDYQVALVTNEVAARSDNGVVLLPHYGREVPLVTPVSYPHTGSGLVNYNYGHSWPEAGNLPPTDPEGLGDPHGRPRKDDKHNEQMIHFFRTGEIIDTCGGPCPAPEG